MTEERSAGKIAGEGEAPLSRPLSAAKVPPEGMEVQVVATETERAALAALNALPAILSLSARLHARRWRGEGLEITGELRARLRQNCVLTLEEFETEVVEPIEARFAPPRDATTQRSRRHAPQRDDADADAFGEDPPDTLVGGGVDLGAIISEFLTLALDPYPRKPGAEFVEPAPAEPSGVASPFAHLQRTRGGSTSEN